MDLKIARTIRRKKQIDITIATGIHQSKFSLIENGYIIPSDEEKALIAKALDFNIYEIDWPAVSNCQECV